MKHDEPPPNDDVDDRTVDDGDANSNHNGNARPDAHRGESASRGTDDHLADGTAILSRRRRLIRRALVGAGMSVAVASSACSQACLSIIPPEDTVTSDADVTDGDDDADGDDADDANNMMDADTTTPQDTRPEVCLGAPIDMTDQSMPSDGEDTTPDDTESGETTG